MKSYKYDFGSKTRNFRNHDNENQRYNRLTRNNPKYCFLMTRGKSPQNWRENSPVIQSYRPKIVTQNKSQNFE